MYSLRNWDYFICFSKFLEIEGSLRSHLPRKTYHNLWCTTIMWGLQWSSIKTLLPHGCNVLNIYSITKVKCTLNCIWDQFSLFKNSFPPVVENSNWQRKYFEFPISGVVYHQQVINTMCCMYLTLCMWSILSATFFYKCGLCPHTLVSASRIPPQHVTLRRTRRQLDFTPREGETDRATVSASVSDCMCSHHLTQAHLRLWVESFQCWQYFLFICKLCLLPKIT